MSEDKLSIHVKVTPKMHSLIAESAKKNDRSIQQETQRLIKVGLHLEQFESSEYE